MASSDGGSARSLLGLAMPRCSPSADGGSGAQDGQWHPVAVLAELGGKMQ